MKRSITALVTFFSLLGCGQREQHAAVSPTTVAENPDSAVKNSTTVSQSPHHGITDNGGETQKSISPPSFEYTCDLTGQAVVKAVAPDTPALTPAERFGMAPQPRTLPAKILNPDMISKSNYVPPTIVVIKPSAVTIAPPPEQIPFDLGRGADMIPARPSLPIAAAVTERVRDVDLPPSMPILGRRLFERVSLDDPTSEFANVAIVNPGVNVPLKSADFVKVAIPDPFELGEQVKPKVPHTAEPGLSPAPVNPQRLK